jgi:hypothetical protein
MPMETQIRGCGLDFESRGTRIKLPSTQQQPTETQRFFLLFFGFLISGGSSRTKHQRIDALLFGRGFAILMSQKADPYNHWLDVLPEESQ